MPGKESQSKKRKYSDDDLEDALRALQEGLSIGKAAEMYGIPKSTLYGKSTGQVPTIAKKGPSTVLTTEEEERLKKWILDKARLGFPMDPSEVQNAAQKLLKDVPRENPFIDDRPGEKWLRLFLKRHTEISIKQTEVISKGRESVTEANLRGWFHQLNDYLEDIGATSVLSRPGSIFNGDETVIQLNPKSGTLMGGQGEKAKEQITVLCTFSAAGVALPPMLFYPYKRIPINIAESVPDHWHVGKSGSGWMVTKTFFDYISKKFYPWCIKNRVEFPVVYFIDGHKSHLSMELSKFCSDHQIILYCLLPNSRHIIQPCNVAIFKPMRSKWSQLVVEYKASTNKCITKHTFAPLFKKVFDQITESSIKNGFRACGLYPFDENAVNYSKCMSKRHQELRKNSVEDIGLSQCSEDGPITRADLISTEKFLRDDLGHETIEEFYNLMYANQKCDDPIYLLWRRCVERLSMYSDCSDAGNCNDSREEKPQMDNMTISVEIKEEN